MENIAFIFAIMGMSMGLIGFTFGLIAMTKVDKLEKQLAKLELLERPSEREE
ncbi:MULTISPECIES: hypothetical protein [unclassified Pseudoalteromonas]|uniref:hypothetical protein n=1 Tax=unclassified Pseudoalteromonas TaxID=194690 RepID=UPI0030143170